MANWDQIKERGNVQDRRMSRPVAVGGGMSIGVLAILLLVNMLGGGNVTEVIQQLPQDTQSNVRTDDASQYEGLDPYELYVSEVTGSADALWQREFAASDLEYRAPTTVLFRDATQSACGGASSAVGPHYCPSDETIYLDETFFDELTQRFGARGGDVAQAYVLAHEMGHHVQNQLGLANARTNEESIAVELQADCFAGVWAHSVEDQGVITRDEVDQAIDAAEAVGDDRIQEATTGRVNPESWTHGSSAQRKQWFLTGFETGDPTKCNTVS